MSLPSVAAPSGAPSLEMLEATLTDYHAFRCIGSGAMGVVYEAHHRPLDRMVAVKVLSPTVAGGQTVERFFREARAMARLSHPHIVPVYEVGGEGLLPFFSMELVDGGSLKDLLQRRGALAPRQAASIARDIAEGLGHAHFAGILHRDVKPGNVLLDQAGRARLTDFGLVRRTDSATLTATDAIVGTPQYMSPEQVRSESMDGRSDQFSLGVTLYEMLAGEPPFRGENPVTVLRAICEATPRSLHKIRPEIPSSLEAIVVRMLEKDRARRYPDLAAAREDLERYLNGEAVEATLPGPVSRNWRRLRANRAASRFALALVLVGAVAFFYLGRDFLQPKDNAALIQDAQNAFTNGDVLRAKLILEREVDAEALGSPEALSLRGNIAFRENDPGLALYYFEDLFERRPDDPVYLDRVLEACRAIGDLERARRHLRLADGAVSAADAVAAAKRRAELSLESANIDRMAVEQCMEEQQRLRRMADAQAPDETIERARLLSLAGAEQRRAFKHLSDARQHLDEFVAAFGGTDRSMLESFILSCQDAFLERDLERRGTKLMAAKETAGQLGFAVWKFSEAGLYANQLMQEIQITMSVPEEVREEAKQLAERYEMLYRTALAATEFARGQMERSFQSIVSPDATPSIGPVGRARAAVGGLLSSVFGGQD